MRQLRLTYAFLAAACLYGGSMIGQTTYNGDSTGFHVFNPSTVELFRVQANGNVGIGTGTDSPATKLHIRGVYGLESAAAGSGNIMMRLEDNSGGLGQNKFDFVTRTTENSFGIVDNYVGAMRFIINSSGNVGIGTTTPNGTLTVRDESNGGSLSVGSVANRAATIGLSPYAGGLGNDYWKLIANPSGNSYRFDIADGGTNRLSILYNSGNVGIGTTSPASQLEIGPYLSPVQFLDRTIHGLGFELNMPAGSEIDLEGLQIGTSAMPTINTVSGPLYLQYAAGDVNIGNGTHGNLTVAGTVTAGTIYANYQDLAEWVPAAESMPAGTVVVISDESKNTVTASTRAYDTGVAGVVSASPGLLLGTASDSKAKIATTGRVNVRVDASRGPVRMGDLLVTSDRPGMAMKSEPLDVGGVKMHRPGTLIGKALEPLAGGEGEILVLLSLQ
jgi:hypothetical protein